MQYYNDILCITLDDWKSAGLTYKQYENDKDRNFLKVARKGGNGRELLIDFDSIIKNDRRNAIIAKHGDPRKSAEGKKLQDSIVIDSNAIEFYSNYTLGDGRFLPESNASTYAINASILNALVIKFNESRTVRRAKGKGDNKKFFEKATTAIENLIGYEHSLPKNYRHLQRIYKEYVENGYSALISGKFCNDNSRKVTADIENLIMSIYTMDNKPFAKSVLDIYNDFISGTIEIVDKNTGEFFNIKNFMKNGTPIEISESTVWNYLNNPKNRAVVDRKRSGQFQYNNEHRPHHHRKDPYYSFSKISMDDLDLPRKLADGKRVKCYRAYDVTSTCIIGYAYSRSKDEALFIECMRNTMRTIESNGFNLPAEVEVEHHLVNKFFDDLSLMFPFMRICNAGNSQEKRAEHFNKAKKYGIDKKYIKQGRWYAKSEAYRVDVEKIDNEFKTKVYTYEEIVADDIAMTIEYNNSLHPKQKYYPGMTRWQVLQSKLNPNLKPINKIVAYKAFGESDKTSIRRNQYCVVQYGKYVLPNPNIISKLQPNNYNVVAYYLPNADGIINEVYLYQNDIFICRCERIENYNESKIEQTQADVDAYKAQSEYVAEFDKMTKSAKKKLAHVHIISKADLQQVEEVAQTVQIIDFDIPQEESIEDLLKNYNPDDYREIALRNI